MNARSENHEYHELLDDLAGRGFFGEITLYFQGGNVQNSRMTEHNTKSEIRDRMNAKKRREGAVIARVSREKA